ncbi:MAG: WD40/YVTN/BNR-like repeat-containing protein [Candidatus Saccharimonadales bacterium]
MSKKVFIWVGVIGAGLLLLLLLANKPESKTSGSDLTPVSSLRDVHGLAVDVADSNKVWIASHTGLHVLKNDKELFVVGTARDDYMGFSPHPTDANTFFTSGHPSSGGNIGFQKSVDAGKTWQKVSTGANGPVDFHAMAVGQVDPNLVYGWYRGDLQRSRDGGKNWEIVNTNLSRYQVVSFVTDPKDKDTVYATTNAGLLMSKDQGKNWTQLSEALAQDTVLGLALNPTNNQELLVDSQKLGLVKSTDGGKNWSKLDVAWASSGVLYISYDKNKPATVYAITQNLELYKTTDGGSSWQKVTWNNV